MHALSVVIADPDGCTPVFLRGAAIEVYFASLVVKTVLCVLEDGALVQKQCVTQFDKWPVVVLATLIEHLDPVTLIVVDVALFQLYEPKKVLDQKPIKPIEV